MADQETHDFIREHGNYRSSVICVVVSKIKGVDSSDSSDSSDVDDVDD